MEEIKSLQFQVDEWIRNVGLRYFDELTNMAMLTEEVGEVARIIARRYGEQSEKDSDKLKDLGEELADVLFVSLCLANQTGCDLQKAFDKKMKMKSVRDKERHQNNMKLQSRIPLCEMLSGETIQIGGSKSLTNRLLILEKIFGNIELVNISDSQDSSLLLKALHSNINTIDIHHAGTAMRFLTSYYAIQEGETVVLTGSERMQQRPIKPLVEALRKLGAEIEYMGAEGFPPLKITGKSIEKNKVSISAHVSSQFITSLLLIGARLKNGLNLHLEGKITSLPYLLMTIEILKKIGVEVRMEESSICIQPISSNLKPLSCVVESDWSSASYFYSLAAIGRKKINLKSLNMKSLQADCRSVVLYREFFGIESIQVSENEVALQPLPAFKFPTQIDVDMNDCPDITQTLCVTAAALHIPFHITGLETLRVKETDRLVALHNELKKIGLNTEITDDSIRSMEEISMPEEIKISTYNDHRMAMAFAPFALKKAVEIENPSVVEKSYPHFWKDFYKVIKRK
ncbi:3-phosphoshikimate 1-carboxyvinyltransferase [Elizabethkingia argentiflava]|uniref:3-phosphoshikimate 1-carboxyvinyltransferase n=1 Tax=Elizabethkingia argenteiflava TaxID=2681556 RepID=A0A845PYS0_9FLAO|nr:MazG nucleotide pyrophosphohydrolase domain-containing protein [Elizabethkingia argenteiflava]NAW51230.1 3-phosphoshikimate 1-carboxyvinyltransferase [Elizabethkingia argenteiflava]